MKRFHSPFLHEKRFVKEYHSDVLFFCRIFSIGFLPVAVAEPTFCTQQDSRFVRRTDAVRRRTFHTGVARSSGTPVGTEGRRGVLSAPLLLIERGLIIDLVPGPWTRPMGTGHRRDPLGRNDPSKPIPPLPIRRDGATRKCGPCSSVSSSPSSIVSILDPWLTLQHFPPSMPQAVPT